MTKPAQTREDLVALGITTFVALVLAGSAAFAQVIVPVKVEHGLLQGAVEDGLTIYRGILYAAPPIGHLRWRAPEPAAKWDGVRAAIEYGRACLQSNPAIENLPAPSEDCLFVNVWTPAMRANERLPVMVWIHGGGFAAGTPAEKLYHGEWLAKKGVVVVSAAQGAQPSTRDAEGRSHVGHGADVLDQLRQDR